MNPELMFAAAVGNDDRVSESHPMLALPSYLIEERSWGDGSWGLYSSGLWSEPNTVPMLHCDMRSYASATDAADDIAFRARFYIDNARSAKEWSATKPDAWAFFVDGWDATVSTNAQRFVRHPTDALILAEAVGGGSGSMTMYPTVGLAQATAWFAEFLTELEARRLTLGLPHPVAALEDTEGIGDVSGRAFTADFVPLGVFTAALASPKAATYLIDGTRTLNQWMAARTTRPNGTPYPAFPQTVNNNLYPDNFDQRQRAYAAFQTSYMRAWSQAFFGPARALWPRVRTGSWGIWSNSRASPVTDAPNLAGYDVGGYMGAATDSIVPDYSQPHVLSTNTWGDPREGTAQNWATFVGDTYDAADVLQPGRVAAKLMRVRANQLRNRHALMPSVQLALASDDPTLGSAPAIIDAIQAACDQGNTPAVYVFAPDLSTNANARTPYAAMIAAANRRMLATGRYQT